MDFYEELFKLKTLLRTGWLYRHVNGRVESDAEHVFSMLLVALRIMARKDMPLDQLKVVKMIAYHELGEIDVGDITPCDNVSREEKYEMELSAIRRIAAAYDMPEILSIWLEFEEGVSPEAQFVKALDKADAVEQARVYETHGLALKGLYDEFYTRSQAQTDYIRQLNE